MKITLFAVGRIKSSPFKDLSDQYLKRLGGSVTVKEIDSPKSATSTQEAALIDKALPDSCFLIALDERGKSYTSPDFSDHLMIWRDRAVGNHLCFLIGGADGLTNEIRSRANILLSFGQQTWPHMMVRVMLLEQIYRAQQIQVGHPYHRV